MLGRFGEVAIETDPARTAAGWAHVRDVKGFAGQPGDVWRLSIKPSEAAARAGGHRGRWMRCSIGVAV